LEEEKRKVKERKMSNLVEDELIKKGIDEGLLKIEDNRIYYVIQRKDYDFSHPEEKIRARVYCDLVFNHLYPSDRIDFEVVAPARVPPYPADIVVYKEDEKVHGYIVVELKASSSETDIETAKREGLGNARLLSASYLLIVCGKFEATYDLKEEPSLKTLDKYRIPSVPQKYGKVPKYKYVKGGGAFFELSGATLKGLLAKFQKCHNIIWDGGKRDPAIAFDEMSKLMFAKIYDEKFTKDGEPYRFQIGTYEEVHIIGERIRRIYREVQEKEPMVFKEPINVPDYIIYNVVEVLQDTSLTKTDLDAKGRAFESFLGRIFRGEYGQFFTPREIVDFMVKIANPDEKDLVMDPACGSGGFLLYCIKLVRDKIQKNYSDERERLVHDYDFAHYNVYGIEINDRIARVSMMDMVIHDDGHTNIECNDALRDCRFFDPRRSIELGKYSLVLTNPPFGARYKRTEKEYFENYELAKTRTGRIKKSENSEILFIERCIDFLKSGGVLGIVLPDSAFTNKRYIPVVEYIQKKTKILAIISLPQHAFTPFGSMAKTSILFLKKVAQRRKREDYPIFMAHIERIGYDANLRPDQNDFEKVVNEYRAFEENPQKYDSRFYSEELWTVKVMSSQLRNKLDVEAYSREYMNTLEKIFALEKKGFEIKILDELCVDIFAGVGFNKEDYETRGTPIIKTRSIKKIVDHIGRIDWSDIDFVRKKKKYAKKKFIQPYDILVQSVAHTKDYIGDKMAIVEEIPEHFNKVLALSKFLVIRPDLNQVNPFFLFLYLTSPLGREQLKHFIRGMTAEIYEFDVKNLYIAKPTKEVQEEIAQRFHSLMKKYKQTQQKLKEIKSDILNLSQRF